MEIKCQPLNPTWEWKGRCKNTKLNQGWIEHASQGLWGETRRNAIIQTRKCKPPLCLCVLGYGSTFWNADLKPHVFVFEVSYCPWAWWYTSEIPDTQGVGMEEGSWAKVKARYSNWKLTKLRQERDGAWFVWSIAWLASTRTRVQNSNTMKKNWLLLLCELKTSLVQREGFCCCCYCLFVCFYWYWWLNSGLCTCQLGTLSFEPYPSSRY
jgi:hypothetical protein